MALFSKQPPGVQIKRWFFILTLLIVVIDFIAASSLMLVTNLMSSIVKRYDPLVISSGDIASAVSRANTGLYRYLAEYEEDTLNLQKELQELRETIYQASILEAAADLGSNFKEINTVLGTYEKVVKLLPKIGTVTNWKELEELKNHAVTLGGKVEELALTMKTHSYKKIAAKMEWAGKIATTAMYIFVSFLILSLVIIVLLFIWWRNFQDMILRL